MSRGCCRLPSTPLGEVLGGKGVQLQKAAGPEEVQHAVNSSSETQIPVVDSHGEQKIYTQDIIYIFTVFVFQKNPYKNIRYTLIEL